MKPRSIAVAALAAVCLQGSATVVPIGFHAVAPRPPALAQADAGDLALASSAPEPASIGLLLAGIAALATASRGRRA